MDLGNSERHIPWVVFEAKDWLGRFLDKSKNVFEWGSGGSTIYFAKNANKVVSVEHNEIWHKKVLAVIAAEKINNCEYFLIKPRWNLLARFLPYGPYTYVSRTFGEDRNFSFSSYVKKIESFPDNHFDLVFIDGRSRASCIRHSIKKIKKGGFLILDNSERELYRQEMKQLDKFKRIDFFGEGPYLKEKWQTSIWEIN